MPKSQFVDFKAVKAALTMEQVLAHYGLLEKFKRSGDSLSGPCPIHKGNSPNQFRVSLSKNIWNCFSECKHGGNVLDFVSKMENVTIHAAALKAMEWFQIDPEAVAGGDEESEPPASPRKSEPKPSAADPIPMIPNKPLKFRLDKLDRSHPYLKQRGLTLETIIDFGIGHCAKGVMEGRIAIPITNPAGDVVAYAGRWPGTPAEDTPKYKLPPGFKKSQELFNLDRALKEPPEQPLVIVEGFFDCMKLHQLGCRKVVALMGSTMADHQHELLRKHLAPDSQIVVMLDEDAAGSEGRDQMARKLVTDFFVKVHTFAEKGQQPEDLTPEMVATLIP